MPKKEIKIRRASINDIDDIINIWRLLKHDVRYQVRLIFQRPWLLDIINATTCEVYVALLSNIIVGFVIITFDLLEFEKMKNKNKPPFWLRLITILLYPTALKYALNSKLNDLIIYLSCNKVDQIYPQESNYNNIIIISHIAVNTKYQKMGIAKIILSTIENRAVELKRNIIKIDTYSIYKRAISLYEYYGYVRTRSNNKNNECIELKKIIF
ncbi:MAG: GNAT family N-acetyltransferase [Pelosinus sp.]|nr:GNAT family N-acetyltransferase [Pelosinus sp.]